jgi:hypothetical protein
MMLNSMIWLLFTNDSRSKYRRKRRINLQRKKKGSAKALTCRDRSAVEEQRFSLYFSYAVCIGKGKYFIRAIRQGNFQYQFPHSSLSSIVHESVKLVIRRHVTPSKKNQRRFSGCEEASLGGEGRGGGGRQFQKRGLIIRFVLLRASDAEPGDDSHDYKPDQSAQS